MTSKQISELAQLYYERLRNRGCSPSRMDINEALHDEQTHLNHVMWMCRQIIDDRVGETIEKEMRWLCYVQGVLSTLGVFSVNQLRWHNSPEKCADEIRNRINELSAAKKDIDSELFELVELLKIQ